MGNAAAITPMMASLRRGLPHDDDRYGWEFKWDGVRAIANVSGKQGRSATYGWGSWSAAAPGGVVQFPASNRGRRRARALLMSCGASLCPAEQERHPALRPAL